MSEGLNIGSVMCKLLLGTAFIDGNVHESESRVMFDYLDQIDGFTNQDQLEIVDEFISANLKNETDVFSHVAKDIDAIGNIDSKELSVAILIAMGAVAKADGIEHPNEHFLINSCAIAWGLKGN